MSRKHQDPTKFLSPLDKLVVTTNGEEQHPKKQKTCNGEHLNGSNTNNNASNGCVIAGFKERSALGESFIKEALPRLLQKAIADQKDKNGKVVEFVQPNNLRNAIDLHISNTPTDNYELESILEKTIQYSVKTGHPYFFNQLFGGLDKLALSGAILTEALNTSAYTFEVAPVFSLMEKEVVQKIVKELVRWPQGDGVFCPGGSAANMYGVSLARFHKFPESKTKGMQGMPAVHIYTSKLSHYSLKKGSFFMGFGLDSIVTVDTDSEGRMIPSALEKAIKNSVANGVVPLMVNATAGTTVMGAYDPLNDIADVCQRNGNVWLHVDGAWGGAVLLSDKLRYKMNGIDRVDSLTWDPHKMAGSILQCALVVTKHVNSLQEAHSTNARYLFQQDKVYDVSFDSGDKSVQCGRKIDAFKLWVQWKAYGNVGMAQRIEHCFETALYLRDRCKTTPGFRLLIDEPECTNVCFWYIPPSLRGQTEDAEWWQKLSKVAPAIKGQMQLTGSMMIGYQPQEDYVNFFRMIVANPESTPQDMDHIIDVITKFGEKL